MDPGGHPQARGGRPTTAAHLLRQAALSMARGTTPPTSPRYPPPSPTAGGNTATGFAAGGAGAGAAAAADVPTSSTSALHSILRRLTGSQGPALAAGLGGGGPGGVGGVQGHSDQPSPRAAGPQQPPQTVLHQPQHQFQQLQQFNQHEQRGLRQVSQGQIAGAVTLGAPVRAPSPRPSPPVSPRIMASHPFSSQMPQLPLGRAQPPPRSPALSPMPSPRSPSPLLHEAVVAAAAAAMAGSAQHAQHGPAGSSGYRTHSPAPNPRADLAVAGTRMMVWGQGAGSQGGREPLALSVAAAGGPGKLHPGGSTAAAAGSAAAPTPPACFPGRLRHAPSPRPGGHAAGTPLRAPAAHAAASPGPTVPSKSPAQREQLASTAHAPAPTVPAAAASGGVHEAASEGGWGGQGETSGMRSQRPHSTAAPYSAAASLDHSAAGQQHTRQHTHPHSHLHATGASGSAAGAPAMNAPAAVLPPLALPAPEVGMQEEGGEPRYSPLQLHPHPQHCSPRRKRNRAASRGAPQAQAAHGGALPSEGQQGRHEVEPPLEVVGRVALQSQEQHQEGLDQEESGHVVGQGAGAGAEVEPGWGSLDVRAFEGLLHGRHPLMPGTVVLLQQAGLLL